MTEEKTSTEQPSSWVAATLGAPQQVEQPSSIPAAPGEQQPEQKISELDRAQLSEAWNETAAIRNALVALQADFNRLEAEKRTIEAESKIQELLGQHAQKRFNGKMQEIRQNYNIPEGYQIDAKTGVVSEAPEQQGDKSVEQPASPQQ